MRWFRGKSTMRADRCRTAVAALLLTSAVGSVMASAPSQPLPIPLYSLDRQSPSVIDPPSLPADTVLSVNTAGVAVPVFDAASIGLGRANDDVDDFSFNRAELLPAAPFVLLFSVDRDTIGGVPPSPGMIAAQVPFNVADQAERGHAAGDAFVSLTAYSLKRELVTTGQRPANNVQAINNYDEGGSDFSAQPTTSSRDRAGQVQEDNVDGMSAPPQQMRQDNGLYYTAAAGSSSLLSGLPGDSPADVFFDPYPALSGTVGVFAYHDQLGLLPADDIDGLVVFDDNDDGLFNGPDRVLFTLKPGSPSLSLIYGASFNAAADVFSVRLIAGLPVVQVYAPAAQLGLQTPTDHVDALEVLPCSNGPECATAWGIRLIFGDWTNDGHVDLGDLPHFLDCLTGPLIESLPLPLPPCFEVFDFDFDKDVDLADFSAFQRVFGTAL